MLRTTLMAGWMVAGALSALSRAQVRTYDDGHVTPLPPNQSVVIERGVIFHELGLNADVYRPAESGDELLPVVILWNASRHELKDHPQYTGWGRLIAARGLAAVAYEGARDTADTDAKELLDWLEREGFDYGLDAERMCSWSCSGNVLKALPHALADNTGKLRCAVVYYGAPLETASLRPDLPLFIARAGLDNSDLNRRLGSLASAAVATGAELEFHHYAMGSHGFELVDDTRESRRIVQSTLDFMHSHLQQDTMAGVQAGSRLVAATAAEQAGDWELAFECYDEALAEVPQDIRWVFRRGLAAISLGEYDLAIDDFDQCVKAGFSVSTANYNGACAAALSGQSTRALDFLEAALAAGYSPRASMKTDADLESLRDLPRFQQLVGGS